MDGHLNDVSRRGFLASTALFVLAGSSAFLLAACGDTGSKRPTASGSAPGKAVTLHRQEGCGCCATYAEYLEENGFTVDINTVDDMDPIRERYGIPEDAVGCHTSVIDDYVVEGHVPVEAIERLLSERPAIEGISVVGMPSNSPGMGAPTGQPLEILSFGDGRVATYMSVATF